jgi:hypothetical protein
MRRGFIPLLAVLAAGCGGGGSTSGPTPTAGTPGKVELTAVTVADLDAAIARHKGKVVYIDCWFLG